MKARFIPIICGAVVFAALASCGKAKGSAVYEPVAQDAVSPGASAPAADIAPAPDEPDAAESDGLEPVSGQTAATASPAAVKPSDEFGEEPLEADENFVPEAESEKPYNLIERIDGSTATIPLSEAALDAYLGGHEGLVHNRTGEAYRRLIEKECDIVFCTYPSQNEFEHAEQKGVELEITPVANDALVFINNIENPR